MVQMALHGDGQLVVCVEALTPRWEKFQGGIQGSSSNRRADG